jgi:spermidine synthase
MTDRSFAPLPLLLFASGCAALIYQIVWFQLLGLVIGASAPSVGVLLGTFMGGLCLGSLLLPRLVSATRHPLIVFAALEIGIALAGLAVLVALPAIGERYLASASGGGIAGRAVAAAVCLLPPTMLMGATLPAIARSVGATPLGISRTGLLYAANIAGGVLGCVGAGFYLLRVYDVSIATFAAAGINVAAAVAALALAVAVPRTDTRAWKQGRFAFSANAWPIYVTTCLSGMTALAAEVLWTRYLALLFGPTVYTFALILAVFLAGLGAGSGVGSGLARRVEPRRALGACQLLLAAAIAWAAFAAARSLPYWPLDVTLASPSSAMLQLDLLRAAWVILPAALLWGASFPLALAAAAESGREDPAELVGGLYAANTVGAIVGALSTSLVLIVSFGSRVTQQGMIVVSVAAGLLVLAPLGRRRRWRLADGAIGAAIVAGALLLVRGVPSVPSELIAYGRFMPTRGAGADVIYTAEGLTGALAVSREANGMLTYHSAGKPQASTYPQDMRLQRMLGHLTTLVPESSKRFLVIGLGAGVTAGAVSIDPNAERVVVAEIEPRAREVAARYFRAQNFSVVDDPKVDLRFDDGRHFLATSGETFDGITSDPLDPWVKGAATLYTREFWQLAASRLNPGGVVTVFVQLYESTEAAVKSELATFFEVFPEGAVFANTVQGTGYDLVLLARKGGAPIDVDLVAERLARPEHARVAASLRDVGIHSAADLLGTYAGRRADLEDWLRGAALNTDRNLRLQYLAGAGLNLYRAEEIFRGMTAHGIAFPDELFVGSDASLDALRQAMGVRSRFEPWRRP